MGGRSANSNIGSGRNANLSNMTSEQLNQLYDTAVANRDRDTLTNILSELNRRSEQQPEESRTITYTSANTRRRGTRGRR